MEGLTLMKMMNESYTRLTKIILEGGDFSALEDTLKRDLDEIGRAMLGQVVSEVDEILLGSEERKKHWTVKRIRERSRNKSTERKTYLCVRMKIILPSEKKAISNSIRESLL